MKMTKKKASIFGLAATTLFTVGGFSGCVYGPPVSPNDNDPECVYGPPSYFESEDNENVDVYGPPEMFDVEDNEVPGVYGPPESFDVENNENEDVYGPPLDEVDVEEDEHPEKPENIKPDNGKTDAGKPGGKPEEEFRPDLNVPEPVYGPPQDEE